MTMTVEAHAMALFTRVMGRSVQEAKIIFEHVRREFHDRHLHLYTVYRFIHGRKPGHGMSVDCAVDLAGE